MTIIAIMGDRPRVKPTTAGLRRAAELGHHDAGQVEAILQDTWGHLKPEQGRLYQGHILFTLTCNREITILDWEFDDLSGGPWFAEHLMEFVCSKVPNDLKEFRLWRFDGTYRELKNGKGRFSGKVRPMRVQYRFPAKTDGRRKAA